MPEVDPTAAANQAIELFDKDGSGSLDESELAACPGVLEARERYDTDGDGQISLEEMAARISKIYAGGTSWGLVNCRVVQGGTPITGAVVRFLPEPFLEDALEPATGRTDNQGRVNPAVDDDKLPDDKKGLRVMRLGIYRVEVEHPNVKQPHKPLGCEIDNQHMRGGAELILQL